MAIALLVFLCIFAIFAVVAGSGPYKDYHLSLACYGLIIYGATVVNSILGAEPPSLLYAVIAVLSGGFWALFKRQEAKSTAALTLAYCVLQSIYFIAWLLNVSTPFNALPMATLFAVAYLIIATPSVFEALTDSGPRRNFWPNWYKDR